MAPIIGRIAFTMGILVLILSLVPLPFVPRGSPEFVVNVIALVCSIIFLALVTWNVRRAARLPYPPLHNLQEDERDGQEKTDTM